MAVGIGIALIVFATVWAMVAGVIAYVYRTPLDVFAGIVVPVLLGAAGVLMIYLAGTP